MSTKEVGWAPSDPWFEPGFKSLMKYKILATKFSAFHDRGNDPRTSTDFEDIVYLLDSRLNIVDEIRSAPGNVSKYLKEQLNVFLNDNISESISCHLSPFQSEDLNPCQKTLIRNQI